MANILLVGEDRTRTGGFKSLLAMDGHRVSQVREAERWREAEKDAATEVVVLAAADPAFYLSPAKGTVHGFPAPVLLVQPLLGRQLVHLDSVRPAPVVDSPR